MLGKAIVAGLVLSVASGAGTDHEKERHCVARVVGKKDDGELILSSPKCYPTFAEAMADASEGALELDESVPGSVLASDARVKATVSSFTLGVHYDGFSGTGSSISIVGSDCGGGWWNATGFWNNRISSSYNGCYRLTHYDGSNKTGSSEATVGSGAVHNLTYMNNRTGSVSYS
jgi:hypothetical protein